MRSERVVIVGGGQAGFQTAASLRAEGFDGTITLIGEEPGLPYQRPPLSKGILLGKQQERHAVLRPAEFYAQQRIDLVTGRRVASLDLAARRAILDSGSHLDYDWLVLATGARNRVLPGLDGAHYVRTLGESLELRERLEHASDVVVIGGGFIGLEVASAARTLGKGVTVTEVAPRLMARVMAPVVSEFFLEQHRAHGVDVKLGHSGPAPGADLVVAGVGVTPNVELAQDAGLPVGNGIQVDEHLRTPDPRIFAIGDCAEYPNPYAGTRVRLESVQNAVDQAACVAKSIAHGAEAPYDAAPWFWSDQFGIHLQMAGLGGNADRTVTRGEPASGKFSVFYYREGMLRAIDSIHRPAEHLTARKLIGTRAQVSPEEAADESFDLKSRI